MGMKAKNNHWLCQQRPLVYACVALALLLVASYLICRKITGPGMIQKHGDDAHPFTEFKTKLKEVCEHPKLKVPEYNGPQSFFEFLMNPDVEFCYSFLEFGGEKIISKKKNTTECMGEIRKSKIVCFNEEYEMNKDPCLVYSFTKDADQQFERDMHMFSCNVHVFDAKQITVGEQVQRTEFWREHAWDISEYPYDVPAADEEGYKNAYGGTIRRRSLDFITHVLGHEGKVIKVLKSDHEGREWILLKNVIMHSDLVDIQQIALRLHIPLGINTMSETVRHRYLEDLFEVFQGLSCVGYKYILARPVTYYRGRIRIPEVNKAYYPAYEINFAKVLEGSRTHNSLAFSS